jgi:hypothetical protein
LVDGLAIFDHLQDHLVLLIELDEVVLVTDRRSLRHKFVMVHIQIKLCAGRCLHSFGRHDLALFLLQIHQHFLGSFDPVLVWCACDCLGEIDVVD